MILVYKNIFKYNNLFDKIIYSIIKHYNNYPVYKRIVNLMKI